MTTLPTFAIDLKPAFSTFLSTLAAAQQNNETIDRMSTMINTLQTHLDEKWNTLNDLAEQGLDQSLCSMLDVFLREWALMSALALIVDREAWVDPYDQGVQNAFWEKLSRQHTWLASRLLLPYSKEVKDRNAQASTANLEETLIKAAEQGIERQFQRNWELSRTVNDLLGQLQKQLDTTPEAVRMAHDDARTSLYVAIDAVNESRQTASSFLQPAVDIMWYAGEHVWQALPSQVESAVERVESHRAIRRLWLVMWIGMAWLVATIFVFIGLHHLY
jgi:hypothetical protein